MMFSSSSNSKHNLPPTLKSPISKIISLPNGLNRKGSSNERVQGTRLSQNSQRTQNLPTPFNNKEQRLNTLLPVTQSTLLMLSNEIKTRRINRNQHPISLNEPPALRKHLTTHTVNNNIKHTILSL